MNQKTKRKTKLTSLLLVLCMVVAMLPSFTIDLTAFAAETATSNPSDDWEYSLNADGTATLTEYTGTATDVYIPSNITDDAGERISVTALGDGVFKNNTGINSATFGEGITTIGASAFEGATNLVCIVSPETLTTIGDRAFYGCTVFNSVILYDAVTSIGADVFAECPNVTVWVNENCTAYNYAKSNNIAYEIIGTDTKPEIYTINGVTYYIQNGEAYATSCNSSVANLVIPASVEGYPVTDINTAFRSSYISSIVLPYTLKTIEAEAFYNCFRLSSVTILGQVRNIEEYAFYGCSNLTSITMPNAIGSIARVAFDGCYKLTTIEIPKGITSIGRAAFSDCSKLESIILHDGITFIDEMAFYSCSSLKSITIPVGVTTISSWMFGYCKSLTDVEFHSNLRTIKTYAFYGCEALTDITLPDGIKGISENAFVDCSLVKVKLSPSITYLNVESFPSTTILVVDENSYAHNFAVTNNLLCFVSTNGSEPELYTIDGVVYYIINNEAVVVSYDKSITEPVIPESIEGYPVVDIKTTFKQTDIRSITLPKTLKKIGEKAFWHCESLTSITMADGITSIGEGAFSYCYALTGITIPDTVKSIGYEAFEQCKKLANVTLSASLTSIGGDAFYDCISLTSIAIPDGVEVISSMAFYNCSSLTSVTIPDSVKCISSYAFKNCNSLTSVTIPSGVTEISGSAFYGCPIKTVKIPSSVTKMSTASFPSTTILLVEEGSFAYNFASENNLLYFVISGDEEPELYTLNGVMYYISETGAIAVSYDGSVTDLIIPETIEGYPVVDIKKTFQKSKIKKISLPSTITNLGDHTFYECTNLTSITLPDSITSLGAYTFYECTSLTSITLPDSVKSIGEYAFYNCNALLSITIPNGVTSIGYKAFSNCSKLTSVVIPDTVTNIADWAFYACSRLTNIKLPADLTEIESSVFHSCTGLRSIVIPDGVITIGSGAFQQCSYLQNVTIPNSVIRIEDHAFLLCERLSDITIPSNVTSIGNAVFKYAPIEMVNLPANTTIQRDSFPDTTILLVKENSYTHNFAKSNNLLHFVLHKVNNPEIDYGSGISGTVTLDGSPASGATVELLYDDGVVKETVTTDANGAYSFTYAEVGAYTVRATVGSASGTEKVSVKRMNAFDVFLSGETDIVLKGAYTVSGSVSPATATVTLTDTDGNVIQKLDVTNGTYSFANVPNGSYIVKTETENGSAVREVTVFNGDVTVEDITIASQNAIIKGTTVLEKNGKHNPKIWIEVTLYDMDGNAVDSVKTESDGSYSFSGVPLGDYAIVARTVEMENHEEKGYLKPNNYAGFAYVEAEAAGTYEVETIYLREGRKNKSGLSGKVTAHGEHQACEVTLRDIFGNESARSLTTEKNGKYEFCNVADGIYVITAITESNGMGFTVVGVIDGIAFGETDIVVYKDEKVKERENTRHDRIPHCSGRDDAIKYRDKIAEEKRWYDGLSPKKKRHCSKEYIDWLMQLIEWITELKCEAPNGATLSGGEEVLSGDELESDDTFTLTLEISDGSETEIGEDGIQTDEQFVQQSIHDAAGDKTIAKYYNISLSKTDGKGTHNIKSIARDTDTTGKVRITMDIPEEYRGHKHYHFVHVHNGEPMTLVDLDDNPDTITFEVDRFSTFALTYTDEVLSVDGEVEEEEVEETNFGTLNAYIKDIKYQTDDSATRYSVILLSGIDSLNYREVGFEVKSMGITNETGTKVVYKKVNAYDSSGNLVEVIPTMFGAKMSHIFAQEYNFSDAFKNAALAFRPYAIKMNGEKIYGKETSIDIIFNERD